MLRRRTCAVAFIAILSACSALFAPAATIEERLKEAASEVSYFSFDEGYRIFSEVRQEVPEGSDAWIEAAFGEAVCLHQTPPAEAGRLARAAGLYETISAKYPKSKYAAPSLIALGRIAELVDYLDDVTDRAKAREYYAKARDLVGPEQQIAHEATLRIAAAYIQTYEKADVRQGIGILEQWLAKYPTNPLASAMWQYIGDAYFIPLGEYARSLDAYMKADELGLVEVGREGPLYWRMANLAERINNRDLAVKFYTRIILETATSGKAYESQLALKRLGAPVPEITLFGRRPATTQSATTQAVQP